MFAAQASDPLLKIRQVMSTSANPNIVIALAANKASDFDLRSTDVDGKLLWIE